MVRAWLWALIAATPFLMAASCDGPRERIVYQDRIVDRAVPVPVRPDIAPELIVTIARPAGPLFVAPGTAGSEAALAPGAGDTLRAYIQLLEARINGWVAWATAAPAGAGPPP